MAYRIIGLDPAPFAHLFGASDLYLKELGVSRLMVATHSSSPCRVTLDDAAVGEAVLLLNHVSVDQGPYRASHAIFVTEGVLGAARFDNVMSPALQSRVLSLRAFDQGAMIIDAALAQPGQGDAGVRRLFDNPAVAYVHAHYATRGCFAAAIERTQ